MKKFLFFFCILTGIAQADETLNDALQKAMKHNFKVQAAGYAEEAAEQRLQQASRGFLPSIVADGTFGYIQTDRVGVGRSNFPQRNASVRITQDLWTSGRNSSEEMEADFLHKASREGLTSTEQEILYQTVQTYMNLYQSIEILNLHKKNISVLKENLKAADERYKFGEGTKTDIAQTRARLAEAKAEFIKAEAEVESAKASYNLMTGSYPEGTLKREDAPVIPQNIKDLLQTAKKKNPFVKKAYYEYEAAKVGIDKADAENDPYLRLEGGSNYQKGNSVFERDEVTTNYLVARLTVPIFDKGKEYPRVREANAEAERTKATYMDSVLRLEQDITDAYYKMNAAREAVVSHEEQVQAAATALDGMKQEQQYGFRSNTEVLDTERDLLDAQTSLVSAKSDYATSAYRVLALTTFIAPSNEAKLATTVKPVDNKEIENNITTKIDAVEKVSTEKLKNISSQNTMQPIEDNTIETFKSDTENELD